MSITCKNEHRITDSIRDNECAMCALEKLKAYNEKLKQFARYIVDNQYRNYDILINACANGLIKNLDEDGNFDKTDILK